MNLPQLSRPVIRRAGASCAVGLGVRQVYASVQAGIGRVRGSSLLDQRLEPFNLALFPEAALEPLAPALEPRTFNDRHRRIVRLCAAPLREAMSDTAAGAPPPPLFIGLPEARPGEPFAAAAEIAGALVAQSGVPLDEARSQSFPRGRAAALVALEAGAQWLRAGHGDSVLVGGADSHLDPGLLGELDRQGRVHGPQVAHGFTPGEAAGFVLLTSASARGGRSHGAPQLDVALLGVGLTRDPAHRYSDRPLLGEGLSAALDTLFAGLARRPPAIESTFADMNGEMLGAKEWGVASIRHADRFSPAARLHHPADCFGDVGAASGALLLALGATALARGDRRGPVLVWGSSDREDRACALLDAVA